MSDTSKQFIAMADCPEIQEMRKSEEDWIRGDYHVYRHSPDAGPSIFSYFEFQCFKADSSIWLPRQDQLQDMVDWSKDITLIKLIYNWVALSVNYASQFTSMEQLWLAFVMKEKFNKVWDKTAWVTVNSA